MKQEAHGGCGVFTLDSGDRFAWIVHGITQQITVTNISAGKAKTTQLGESAPEDLAETIANENWGMAYDSDP